MGSVRGRQGGGDISQFIKSAASLIAAADGLIITAGAGMSVDSGLPDYRGDHGFWRSTVHSSEHRIPFERLSSSVAFAKVPELAWGFFGHRLELYRSTMPHAGYSLLNEIASSTTYGAFVVTSNVDGQFEKAGFDPSRIYEMHGSINYLQCVDECSQAIWSADRFFPLVDVPSCKLISKLPSCHDCGGLARPNILMYSDWGWADARSNAQKERFRRWRQKVSRPVVIEIGAGEAIPAVRRFGERQKLPLIRINPIHVGLSDRMRERGSVEVPLTALKAIQSIAFHRR